TRSSYANGPTRRSAVRSRDSCTRRSSRPASSSSSVAQANSSSTTRTRAARWCCARSAELIDFTPFGYLRNPAHRATSWTETRGGNLRAAPDYVGVEWVYPVGRDPISRAGLGLETTIGGRACGTRADFEAIGLTSRYHTSSILG